MFKNRLLLPRFNGCETYQTNAFRMFNKRLIAPNCLSICKVHFQSSYVSSYEGELTNIITLKKKQDVATKNKF